MASNIVWGLDIGSSAIKAVKMQRSGADCSIIDFDIIDIPGGEDAAERPARLSAAMKNLIESHKFGNDPVFLAIPGAVCLHREFTLPPSPEARVHEMVQFEAKQQIPFPLDQVEWGYERFEGGEENKGINITLIAVRKSDIQELLTLSENFNLKLIGISAAPVSLYNFINYEFKPQQITLILDAGARGTDFVVMNHRQIYFRSIQIAGREITRVLENKFKVPYDKAESLKKNIEKSPQMDQILTVIEPTLRNLGADVQRTIGFYKAKSRGQKIAHCYLLGHAFRLPKMAEFLQAQVREAPFAIVEGLQRVQLGPKVNREVWEHEFPTMAVAIGLGLQGLGLSEMKLNLLPQASKGQVQREMWKIWSAAAAVVLLVALGVSYYMATKAADEYTAIKAELEKTVVTVEKAKADEDKAIKPIAEKQELLSRFPRLSHDRGKALQIYNAVLNLKDGNNKPLFGTDTRTFVTNLYVSRAPLMSDHKMAPLRFSKLDRDSKYESLFEPIKPEAKVDLLKLPPELRVDAPLLVILSGEVEVQNKNINSARSAISNLEDALKKFPQVRQQGSPPQPKIEEVYEPQFPVTYEEHVQYYSLDGVLKPIVPGTTPDPAAPAQQEVVNRYEFIPFHIMFAWEDPDDKDVLPPPPPEPTATPVKK
ncbi:MAG: pilus assembly protein PilM [Planctomycetota bacterium]